MASQNDKITRMANQIAAFMASRPEALAREGIANHINDFWEPRMRRQLFGLIDSESADLSLLVHAAAPLIKRPEMSGP